MDVFMSSDVAVLIKVHHVPVGHTNYFRIRRLTACRHLCVLWKDVSDVYGVMPWELKPCSSTIVRVLSF